MNRRPPSSTRTDTLFPYPTLFRSSVALFVLASPVAAQQAGTLVSAVPMRDTPAGMQAWQVRYWTTNQDGVRQQVTGAVVAPREAAPPRPRREIGRAHV